MGTQQLLLSDVKAGAPPPAYRQDNFNTLDLATNWALWNGNGGSCQALIRSNQLNMDVGAGSGVFEGIKSKTAMDLTDRFVSIQAVNWSLASVNCVLGIYDFATTGNRIEATLAASTLYLAIAGQPGTSIGGLSGYFRFSYKSSDSKFYIEYSVDNGSIMYPYTTLYSGTSSLNPTSVMFTCYPYSFGGSGQTMIVDNFNSNVPV
jgi:hypothetical protein